MNTTNNNTPNNTAENLKNLKQATDNIKAMMSGNTPAQSPLAAAVNSVTSSSVATLEPAAEVQTFTYNNMAVRMIEQDGTALFCLADICKSCGLSNPRKAAQQIKEEFDEGGNLKLHPLQTAGGMQNYTMVTEDQMYFVMMRGRSQASKDFRQWICKKVMPSIRRTGSYIHGMELPKRNEFGKYDVTYTEVAKQLQDNYNMDENSRTVMQWIIERAKKQGMIIGASMEQKKQSIISDTAAAQVSEVNKKEGEIMALKNQIEELNSKVALWKAESEKNWKECQLRGGALEVLLVHPQDPFVRNLAKSILGWNK